MFDTELIRDYCQTVRRHLHSHPELAGQETATARFVGDELRAMGLAPLALPNNAVIARLTLSERGPMIGLRADMDALPIQEQTEASFASTVPGVMHACGHDGHTAILLGLAKALTLSPTGGQGTIVFIFQPSEETLPGGALDVIESGAIDGVEAILGLHIVPWLQTGQIGSCPGPFMGSVDEFKVEIIGHGGHGATPHQCIDPIVVGAQLVSAWQTIVTRRVNPIEPVVLTVGSFHGGTAFNIIPDCVTLTGTVRALSELVRASVEADFRDMTSLVCASAGAACDIEYSHGYPVLENDPALFAAITDAATREFGAENVVTVKPMLGAEDFAYYARKCPILFVNLGGGNETKGINNPLHSSKFDFDEQAMVTGVRYYLGALRTLWSRD